MKSKKNYKCNTCDKDFGQQSSLNLHDRIVHQKSMEIKCNYCDKMSISPSTLEFHVKSMHANQTYLCKLCPNEYSQRAGLSQHIKRKHSI